MIPTFIKEKTRQWKSGRTPQTGTIASGENFEQEFNRVYDNEKYIIDKLKKEYENLVGTSGIVTGGEVTYNSKTKKLEIKALTGFDANGNLIKAPAIMDRDLLTGKYKLAIRYKTENKTKDGVIFLTDSYELIEKTGALGSGDVYLAEIDASDSENITVTDKRYLLKSYAKDHPEIISHFPIRGFVVINFSFLSKTLAQLKDFLLGKIKDDNTALNPVAPKTNPLTSSGYTEEELEDLETAKKIQVRIKGGGGAGGTSASSLLGLNSPGAGGGGAGYEAYRLLDFNLIDKLAFVAGHGGVSVNPVRSVGTVRTGGTGGRGGNSILRKNNVLVGHGGGGYGGYHKQISYSTNNIKVLIDGKGGHGYPNGQAGGGFGRDGNSIATNEGSGAYGWFGTTRFRGIGGGSRGTVRFNSNSPAIGAAGQPGGMILTW